MPTLTRELVEGRVTQLAPPGTEILALAAPTNTGSVPMCVFGDPNGAALDPDSLPSLMTVFTKGQWYQPDQQIQLQPTDAEGGAFDLGSYCGTMMPSGAVAHVRDVAGTWAGFASDVIVPPAPDANVTVSLLDATGLDAFSVGDEVEAAGRLYEFVSFSGTIGGTITLKFKAKNVGRMEMTA